jgi:predicted ester cyclase
MVAEGDEVVTRVTIHATQAGASGVAQPMAWSGIGIIRIRDGRITEQWADTDSIGAALTALRQQPT